jgi:zinc transport system substrate-binding protein
MRHSSHPSGFPPLLLLALLLLPACGPPESSSPSADTLQVTVSIPPQANFVQRIGGDHVTVQTFVDQGQDPHHFSATPRQIMGLARSKAYFTTGMPFEEALVAKLQDSHPDLRIVETSDPAALKEAADAHDHDAPAGEEPQSGEASPPHDEETPEAEDEHGHGHHHDFDPHVWLSPPLIVQQATAIHDTLVDLDPANQSTYDSNLADFTFEVDALHHELSELLAPHKGKAFFVYHPAFTHFADAYGLEQNSIEAEGKSPTPKQLMQLVQDARDQGARVIFVQPQIDSSSAQTIAEAIGGEVVTIDPLADDVLSNLETIAKALTDSFNRQ